MKKMRILLSVTVLGLMLTVAGCNRAELKDLKAELVKTQKDRDSLASQLSSEKHKVGKHEAQNTDLGDMRTGLQKEIERLSTSNAELELQVAALTKGRQTLEKQVSELKNQANTLTESRDAALAEAENAKGRIDALASQLDSEKKKVRDLQDQLKLVQAAIADLQKKFSL
ncbi:MAG TPA: hypothetical protein ENI81_11535 [Phycisphaerales bacterium]|nr:hypothetical protein [Phycisphaerales bacterium]